MFYSFNLHNTCFFTAVKDFACIGIHTKPSDAVNEISHLVDVYNSAVTKWRDLKNVIIMGDFNAGCSYVQLAQFKQINLAKNHGFSWLINDNLDTTAGNTNCPYDRYFNLLSTSCKTSQNTAKKRVETSTGTSARLFRVTCNKVQSTLMQKN